MVIVGLVVGYSNLKIAAGDAGGAPQVLVRPAGAAPAQRLGERVGSGPAPTDGITVDVRGQRWIAAVEPGRLENWQRPLHEDYAASPAYEALVKAGLVLADYRRIDQLVTGLPVSQAREPRRAMLLMVLSLFVIFPLPSFMEFVLAPALTPVVAWLYVPYLFLCFMLPLVALRQPRTRDALWRDPFRRARPWLLAAATMLALAVVAFAYTAYVIVPNAIPVYTISENELRELYFADELVAGFIGLAIIFLGRAVLSNNVLTERLQGGTGLFARWRNVVGVAVIGSLFVALLYNLNIRPIYSVLLTVILAVMGGTSPLPL